jgi:uncharacterized protein
MQARTANGAAMEPISSTLVNGVAHDRSHWQHGPIDIVMDLHGALDAIALAKQAMWLRFPTILPELVGQLRSLRSDAKSLHQHVFEGSVALRMFHAVRPFSSLFITPMAAVAGSVAQELLEVAKNFDLTKAIINNGGDIAFFAQSGEVVTVRLLAPLGNLAFCTSHPEEYGVATSGWSGRSFSLGIADAVTVVASTAALADACATMIANAVGPSMEHPGIIRVPANQLKDDTDLGTRLVTKSVATLPAIVVKQALQEGEQYAKALVREGLILAASLSLQGDSVIVHSPTMQHKLAA